jgi:hypothetical protein
LAFRHFLFCGSQNSSRKKCNGILTCTHLSMNLWNGIAGGFCGCSWSLFSTLS